MSKIIFCQENEKLSLLINQDKENILNENKYISFNELIAKFYFNYDEKAIAYLMEKYNYNYDAAKLVIDNLVAIDRGNYKSNKLNWLNDIKNELSQKNLIVIDELFKDYLKRFELYYIGENLDPFTKSLMDKLGAKQVTSEKTAYQLPSVAVFDNATLELEYLFQKIVELLKSDIDFSKIKVLGLGSDYEKEATRLSNIFGIHFNTYKKKLFAYHITKKYLELLNTFESFDQSLDSLKEIYSPQNPKYSKFYKALVRSINKVNNLEVSFDIKYQIFLAIIENVSFDNRFKYEIEVISLENASVSSDDHLLVVGLNHNQLPPIYKDEDYLLDKEKEELGLETSKEKNARLSSKLKDLISSTKNIYLSANLYAGEERKVSSLVDELNLEVISNPKLDKIYSSTLAQRTLAKYLDDYIKYDFKHEDLESYYSTFDIDYRMFDNKFKPIELDKIENHIGEKLIMSYSSLNTFNHCAFRYYIENILKLNKYEETIYTMIGNLFHEILSRIIKESKTVEELWDEEVNKFEFNKSQLALLKKLKKELCYIAERVEMLHDQSLFKDILTEEKILLELDDKTHFKGFIDKVMHLDKDGEDLLVLIDYKTGTVDVKLKNIDYGFDMQLPVYWYLLKRSGLFANPRFTGMYLQQILHEEAILKADEELDKTKEEKLKLSGYSINDPNLLEEFDPSTENSQFIRGIKLTKTGELAKNPRLLTEEEVKLVDGKVASKIDEAKNRIWQGDFKIDPKFFDNSLMGCKYCTYRDICFKTGDDIVYFEKGVIDDDNMDE